MLQNINRGRIVSKFKNIFLFMCVILAGVASIAEARIVQIGNEYQILDEVIPTNGIVTVDARDLSQRIGIFDYVEFQVSSASITTASLHLLTVSNNYTPSVSPITLTKGVPHLLRGYNRVMVTIPHYNASGSTTANGNIRFFRQSSSSNVGINAPVDGLLVTGSFTAANPPARSVAGYGLKYIVITSNYLSDFIVTVNQNASSDALLTNALFPSWSEILIKEVSIISSENRAWDVYFYDNNGVSIVNSTNFDLDSFTGQAVWAMSDATRINAAGPYRYVMTGLNLLVRDLSATGKVLTSLINRSATAKANGISGYVKVIIKGIIAN